MNKEQISPDFLEQMEADGFSVQAILAGITDEDCFSESVRKIRLQTGFRYSRKEIKRALNGREKPEPEFIDPGTAGVISKLKQRGGKKWLQGTNELEFKKILSELSGEKKMDVLIWNCFDFEWVPAEIPGNYPSCVIRDTVDTSIVNYHSSRAAEVLEILGAVGPIAPIVLTPSNEAFAQKWNYTQTLPERQRVVDSVTVQLNDIVKAAIPAISVTVMRFDDYLKSRGITDSPEYLTAEGTDIFRRKLAEDLRLRQETVKDNREYLEQFGINVSDEEIEKFVSGYFGVYAGEGIGISKIVKSGQKVMVIDLEEGRVAKTTIEGANKAFADGVGEIFPIVSPLLPEEKLEFYQWKKKIIKARKSKI